MKLLINEYTVLLFFVGFLSAVKFRCDYTYSGNIGWFKYHKIPATWRDARLRCRFEGGMLASPTTPQIKNLMMSAISNVDIFTGIHATVSQGDYYTLNGIPLDSLHVSWAENEPDNKNNAESCIAMNSEGNFSDVRCDETRPYMCYREKSLTTATICGTPDPDYHFEARTNSCYKFHTTPRSYKRANFICSAEGGYLAIVNSDIESQALSELYAKYPADKLVGNFFKDYAYIGFHNWGEGAEWATIHDQSLAQAGFSRFGPGQPDNATEGEYCGSIHRDGSLNDLWCERHFVFICEKKVDYPAVCDSNDFSEENALQLTQCQN